MICYRIITLILAILFPFRVFTQVQNVSVRHLSIEDGLSHRHIYHIFQDSKGFLWFSTSFGINRYDGKEFKTFSRTENGFSRDISANILEDKNGHIWFQHFRDYVSEKSEFWIVDIFDPIKKRAKELSAAFEVPFSSADIHWMGGDASRNIWLGLNSGALFKYDGKEFRKVTNDAPSHFLEDITITSDNTIGILSGKQLKILDTLGNVMNTIALPDSIERIYAGNNGRIWLEQYVPSQKKHGKDNVLNLVRLWYLEGNVVKPFLMANGQVEDYEKYWYTKHPTTVDKLGRIWVFQNQMIKIIYPSGKLLTANFYEDLAAKEINPCNFVQDYFNPFDIYFDTNNDAWLGTGNGVFQVSITHPKFTNYLTSNINSVDARGIVEDLQGNLYLVGIGVHEINRETGVSKMISAMGNVGAIRDNKGDLWFGDYLARVLHYIPSSNTFETLQHADFTTTGGPFAAREPYQSHKTGRIWIGTDNTGLAYVDKETKSLFFFDKYNQYPELSKSSVSAFTENEAGTYLCANTGLYLLNEQKGIVAQYSVKTGDLPYDVLLHLYIDKEGIFWLGTSGGGLLRWDRKAGKCQQFTTANGLSDNVIYAVYEDEFNQLWLPSNNGLMRFEKSSHRVTTYLERDGLPTKEFNTHSHYRAADGRLYFGGLGGFTSFDPKDFTRDDLKNISFKLQITQFERFDEKGNSFDETQKLLQSQNITLLPSDRSFYLKFTLPNFIEGDRIRYGYKLDGWQNEWNFIEENFIRINGLPYGQFLLHIKAQNSKGEETLHDLTIPIFVEKPFYLKTWFLVLLIATISGAIIGFFKWRTRQLELDKMLLEKEVADRTQTISGQKVELEKLNATKDRFFTIIAHDMRNAVYNFRGVTDKISFFIERKQPERIHEFGGQINMAVNNLTNLMNNLLDWAILQKGAIAYLPKTINISAIVDETMTSLRDAAETKGIKLENNVLPQLEAYADENALATIIRNLVSNGIKYTPENGNISVSAEMVGDEVCIQVSDNGIGIEPDKTDKLFQIGSNKSKKGTAGEKGSGIGLVLVKELVEINGGQVKVQSEFGKGTTFLVFLPATNKEN